MPKRSADNCATMTNEENDELTARKLRGTHRCHVLLERLPMNLINTSYEQVGKSDNQLGYQSVKMEVESEEEDSYTDTLQLFCESVVSSPDHTLESHVPNNRSCKSSPPECKLQNLPPVSNGNDSHTTKRCNVDSTSNVTAIMLKSVLPTAEAAGDSLLLGASAAADLLARHHLTESLSSVSTPSRMTTVLIRSKQAPGSTEDVADHSYYVCEDASELKKLLIESNNNKHKLNQQLCSERKYSAKLQKKVEMLEAVVIELKHKLELVDPDGYRELAEGKLRAFYSQLGL